jgi:hypothetical protein
MAADAQDMITLTSTEDDSGGPNRSGATTSDTEDIVITDNPEAGVYEATVGGRTAAGLVYNQVGHRVVLMAASVLPEFRGRQQAHRWRPGRAAPARKDRHRLVPVHGGIRQRPSGVCRRPRPRVPWVAHDCARTAAWALRSTKGMP